MSFMVNSIMDSVKIALRIHSDTYNDEIIDLIDAATTDLILSGIYKPDEDGINAIDEKDPLIRRAIIIYCKANFGWENPDAQRLMESYNSLKTHLALAGDYHAV